MNPIQYRINAQDIILEVNEAWMEFTATNGVSTLHPPQVLGKSLLDFISGSAMGALYTVILNRVRQTQTPLVLPFRCDAPAVRRFMELTIHPLPTHEVVFITHLLKRESRAPIALLAAARACNRAFLTICSWCNRIRLTEQEWVEVEDAIMRLALFQVDVLPQITHGICQECYAVVLQTMPTPA